MSEQNTPAYLKSLGISHICGSVLDAKKEFPEGTTLWDRLSYSNKTALSLAERYDGFYTPGFHVHPRYIRESCEKIEKMSKLGVRLISASLCRIWTSGATIPAASLMKLSTLR